MSSIIAILFPFNSVRLLNTCIFDLLLRNLIMMALRLFCDLLVCPILCAISISSSFISAPSSSLAKPMIFFL